MAKTHTPFFFRLFLFIFFCTLAPQLGAQERLIKPGDAIEIVVFEHQELSRRVIVGPSGAINYPFMEGLPVDGISLAKLQDLLALQLSRRVGKRPLVAATFATVDEEILVTVLGAVQTPGTFLIRPDASLQGAVAQAGGFLPSAELDKISIRTMNDGSNGAASIDLRSIMAAGAIERLPKLRNGDVVIVPGAFGTRRVKVLGEVRRPGEYNLYGDGGLLDLLVLAGGTTDAAKLSELTMVSEKQSNSTTIDLDVNQLVRENGLSSLPELQDGDLVFVPKKRFNFWNLAVRVIRDVTTIGSLVYLIVRINR